MKLLREEGILRRDVEVIKASNLLQNVCARCEEVESEESSRVVEGTLFF